MKRQLLALLLGISCAFAQVTSPAWLSQIRLSGLSGEADHRLAVINNKTFSPGENHNLKLKDRTVPVQCLEIRERSVLVQIKDIPSPYELTISGEIHTTGINPVALVPPVALRKVKPFPKVSTPTVEVPVLVQAPTQPKVEDKSIISGLIGFLIGGGLMLIALVSTILGARKIQRAKNEGEALLMETIDNHFLRSHLLLNNLTFLTPSGTTQIDHVLIIDTGIFVIETKHYAGWIFGNPREPQWTQSIFSNKFRFQNPIRQNYGHVKALQDLFDFPKEHFHSVIVFTSTAEFKTDLGPDVLQLSGLISFLSADRPRIYDESKMAYIVGRIEMKRERRSLEMDGYHINNVRRNSTTKSTTRAYKTNMRPRNDFVSAMGDEKYQPKT